jgi:hypothetical protein
MEAVATPDTPRRQNRGIKAVETTIQRGQSLFADGYTIAPTATPMIYAVTTPERLDKKTGELYVIEYTVDASAGTCNCEQFMRYGVCKHEQATRRAIEQAKAAMEAAERLLTPAAAAPPMRPTVSASSLPTPRYGSADWQKRAAADFD